MLTVIQALHKYGLGVFDFKSSGNESSENELQQGLIRLHHLALLRRAYQEGAKYSFMDVAYHSQLSSATDPRDHLYALLGIVNDGEDKDLDPVYHKNNTIAMTCIRYARHFLRQKDNLEVLYGAGMHGHALRAPS